MSDSVKSALRVLMVIEVLTEQPEGMTFPQLCEVLKLPKSSAHGLIRTMVARGHLVHTPADRTYRLGIRLWEAGKAYDRGFDLPTIARPFLRNACDELRETVQLAVLDNIDNVYVGKVEADQRLVLVSELGSRLPAYATGLGKVLLAGLSDDEVRKRHAGVPLERFTASTVGSIDELLDKLHVIRRLGYGTDNGEHTPGVFCIAVPVRRRGAEVVAAISVSVPEIRYNADRQTMIRQVLQEQAAQLSVVLGGARIEQFA